MTADLYQMICGQKLRRAGKGGCVCACFRYVEILDKHSVGRKGMRSGMCRG
jgi:hypothetical protein